MAWIRSQLPEIPHLSADFLRTVDDGEDRQDGTVAITRGPTPVGPSAFTPDFEIQNTISAADDVFWTHGNNSFEIGVEFRRLQSPLENGFSAIRVGTKVSHTVTQLRVPYLHQYIVITFYEVKPFLLLIVHVSGRSAAQHVAILYDEYGPPEIELIRSRLKRAEEKHARWLEAQKE